MQICSPTKDHAWIEIHRGLDLDKNQSFRVNWCDLCGTAEVITHYLYQNLPKTVYKYLPKGVKNNFTIGD